MVFLAKWCCMTCFQVGITLISTWRVQPQKPKGWAFPEGLSDPVKAYQTHKVICTLAQKIMKPTVFLSNTYSVNYDSIWNLLTVIALLISSFLQILNLIVNHEFSFFYKFLLCKRAHFLIVWGNNGYSVGKQNNDYVLWA